MRASTFLSDDVIQFQNSEIFFAGVFHHVDRMTSDLIDVFVVFLINDQVQINEAHSKNAIFPGLICSIHNGRW